MYDPLVITILALCGVNLVLTAYGVSLLEKATHEAEIPFADETVTNSITVSSVKEHVAVREEAHDERIRRMKEELAAKHFPVQRPTNVDDALELDPNVKNLPHSTINAYGQNHTEVSE